MTANGTRGYEGILRKKDETATEDFEKKEMRKVQLFKQW
jgi:hypothetical protein